MIRRRTPSAQRLSQHERHGPGGHEYDREEHEEPPQQALRARRWRPDTCQKSRPVGLAALITKRERILLASQCFGGL